MEAQPWSQEDAEGGRTPLLFTQHGSSLLVSHRATEEGRRQLTSSWGLNKGNQGQSGCGGGRSKKRGSCTGGKGLQQRKGALADQVLLPFVEAHLAEAEAPQDEVEAGGNEAVVADLVVQRVDRAYPGPVAKRGDRRAHCGKGVLAPLPHAHSRTRVPGPAADSRELLFGGRNVFNQDSGVDVEKEAQEHLRGGAGRVGGEGRKPTRTSPCGARVAAARHG